MAKKFNRKIPFEILMDSIEFHDAYRYKICGQLGTLYKCDRIDKETILSYGNTMTLILRPEYAPEIKTEAIFVTDKIIRESDMNYSYFVANRKAAGLM